MSPPASGTASDVRVDYIHCVLFVGATLPCAAWCVQEDRPNLEGMAILTATLPPSCTVLQTSGHGVGLAFYSLLPSVVRAVQRGGG